MTKRYRVPRLPDFAAEDAAEQRLHQRYDRVDDAGWVQRAELVSRVASGINIAGRWADSEDPPAMPTTADALDALRQLRPARQHLDADERDLITACRGAGVTWAQIAEAINVGTEQGAQSRYTKLGGPPKPATPDTTEAAG